VVVYDSYPRAGVENAGTAIPDYLERRAQAPSLEDLAIVSTEAHTLGAQGGPERVLVALSSPSLFDVSFYALQQEGAGFDSTSVWTAQLVLPPTRYREPESWPLFQEQALAALRALPGVAAGGYTSVLPFGTDNEQGNVVIAGLVPAPGVPQP